MDSKPRKILLISLGIFFIILGVIGNIANNWQDFWIGLIFIGIGIYLIVNSSKLPKVSNDKNIKNTKKCKYCKSKIENDAKICPYCKKNQKMPTLVIVALIISIIAIIVVNSNNELYSNENCYISLSDFNQIKNDMTYEQVKNIIGCNGTVMSESEILDIHTIIYYWYGYDGISNANFTFSNDKLINKTQVGLK